MKKARLNIPIMFCFDTNYVIPAAAAFYSLLEHASKEYDYTFYVLHSDITERQQEKLRETIKEFDNCKIEYIDMNHRLDDIWNKIYAGGHFSKEVMYKLLVASIFPNIDKLVVSDVDVIFLDDISDSYFQLTDKDDAYLAGVKPIGKIVGYLDQYAPEWTTSEISKMGNVCGGYLVMNLKKIREDDYEKVFLKALDDNGYRLNQMEQDIFNITCWGKVKHLHLKYVACSYMWDYYKTDEDKETDVNYSKEEIEEAMEHPVQLHYATGIKPWKNPDCTLSEVWYKYIMKTPFAQEFLDSLPYKMVIPDSRVDELIKKRNSHQESEQTKDTFYRKVVKKVPTPVKRVIKDPRLVFSKNGWRRVARRLFKKSYSYIIFDDTFPSDLSPFRYEEFYNYSLDNYNTYFAVTGESLKYLNDNRKIDEIIEEFQRNNPHYYGRMFNVGGPGRDSNLEKLKGVKKPIALFTFVSNIINDKYDNLTFVEENNIPFIVNLYPGGGLKINDKECDQKLKRIFSSKCFRKVIVTQDNVRKYLLDKKFCKEEDIEYIFGVVTPKAILDSSKRRRIYFPEKKNLDICFVAHKYSKKGEDKGYDIFIEMAKKLVKNNKCKRIRFHVVGDFDYDDIDIKDIENKVEFLGILSTYQLADFYRRMDVIVSPTRPFILAKGLFDGFPTGATTEAMINGVVGITTDVLNLNSNRFTNGEDIIIVEPDANKIVKTIEELYADNDKLKRIAAAGKEKATRMYSTEVQIGRRLKVIKNVIKNEHR